jgi:carboxyl-terminal processing protease
LINIAAGWRRSYPAALQSDKDTMSHNYFDSRFRKPGFYQLSGLFLGVLAVLAGCETSKDGNSPLPDVEPNALAARPQGFEAQKSGILLASSPVDLVVERISTGDFAGAEEFCKSPDSQTGPQITQLTGILARYDDVQKKREQKRLGVIEEQQKELAKQRAKIQSDTVEPNDIDVTLAAVIRLRDDSPASEKDAILQEKVVQKVIQKAEQIALQDEKEGRWVDAYAHYYYWMTRLYENDKSYEEHAEQLTEMASIELSLKKSDCGETAMERYEGIEPLMFMRALQVLEVNYVNNIDYVQMCERAIRRCRLLGRVLVDSKEELAWKTDPNRLADWTAQMNALESQMKQDAGPKTMRDIAVCFDQVMEINRKTLQLPQAVVIAHFAESALSAMDPFTNIVWPWDVRDFEKSMTQQFSGIGVEISKETGVLKIASLLPDTPAYRAGLDANDEILAVNGEPTEKLSIFCAVEKITGPKGTKVTLTMRRPSMAKTWDVTIVRDRIAVQPLRGWQRKADGQWDWMVDTANQVGYIRLTTFTETSASDLDEILTRLEKEGLNGLILDLRYNPGGYLNSAAEVADLFIREGVIVKSSPRHGLATYEIAHEKGTHPDYPLVILINESSASASEIVAGALQDPKYRRATLVGQRSYGKGSVQVVSPYTGGNSQLKYTVAYYHLPSDQQVKNRYQMEKQGRKDWGVAPDVEVKMSISELREMLDKQRDNDVLVQAGHDESKAPTKRSSLQQTLDSDPQLATALLVVQSKMIRNGRTLQLPSDPNSFVIKEQE